ncbi:hypothetical protein EC845_3358 [Comamonas sp. BIGb0124]|nr:hypothetical protein EC845_3358 [Comamonas sp. BIGb0124]
MTDLSYGCPANDGLHFLDYGLTWENKNKPSFYLNRGYMMKTVDFKKTMTTLGLATAAACAMPIAANATGYWHQEGSRLTAYPDHLQQGPSRAELQAEARKALKGQDLARSDASNFPAESAAGRGMTRQQIDAETLRYAEQLRAAGVDRATGP